MRLVECRIALSPTAPEAARTLRDLDEAWGQLLSLGRGSEQDLLADASEVKARALVLRRDEGGNRGPSDFAVEFGQSLTSLVGQTQT